MESLRKELGEKFEKYRLTDETLKLSQELDKLVAMEQRRILLKERTA